MRLLVSNPSILIALEQVNFLVPLFNLPIKIHVTDFLYERELKLYSGHKLIQIGLQIQSLDSKMTTLATQYCREISTLCRDESYALILAEKSSFALLTINPELKRLAETKKVNCYQLSSLFDLMLNQQVVTHNSLAQGISTIAATSRCHLVRAEAKLWLSAEYTQQTYLNSFNI